MVPLKGSWTAFTDYKEQIEFFREWGLISPKSTVLPPVMVIDGYFGVPEPCTVVGYKEKYTAVIQLADGYHAIFGEYLAEMQPKCVQKLPRGISFTDVLSDYVVLDIETTGFDRVSDEVIEIAATRYAYGKYVDDFHTLVMPKKRIPSEVTELTGISNEDVSQSPPLEQISLEFIRYIANSPIVGHNLISFDIPFLEAKMGISFSNIVVDTLPMAREAYPLLSSHRLEYLKTALCLDDEASHRADNDVRVTNALLWACLAPRKYESLMWKAFLADKKNTTKIPEASMRSKKRTITSKFSKVDIKTIKSTCSEFDPTHPMFGKCIVFTGNLSISRETAMQMAVDVGAILKTAVSGKTAYLVVGKQDTSVVGDVGMSTKEIRAHDLNKSGKAHISILNEAQFLEIIQNMVV